MFTTFATKSILSSFATAAALATVAAPAQAADLNGESRVVRYGDLDLTTAQGAATLKRRVSHAATAVCGGNDRTDMRVAAQRQACRNVAIASADAQTRPLFAQAQANARVADAGRTLTVASR